MMIPLKPLPMSFPKPAYLPPTDLDMEKGYKFG